MTLPKAHLVYGGNNMAHSGANLIYVRIGYGIPANFTREAYGDPWQYPTWASVQSDMRDVAAWTNFGYFQKCVAEHNTLGYWPHYASVATVVRYNMAGVYAYGDEVRVASNVSGETAKKIEVNLAITNPNNKTWAVGYLTQATDVLGDWAWFAGGAFTTGTDNTSARVVLGTNIVLNNYLFILLSWSPVSAWPEPNETERMNLRLNPYKTTGINDMWLHF